MERGGELVSKNFGPLDLRGQLPNLLISGHSLFPGSGSAQELELQKSGQNPRILDDDESDINVESDNEHELDLRGHCGNLNSGE